MDLNLPGFRPGSTIRSRLAAILAFPVVAVVVLLGVVAAGEVGNYRDSTEVTRAVTLSLAVQDLVQELQTERGLAAGLLGGNVGFRDELPPVQQQVDEQRATVARLTADLGDGQEQVQQALRDLDGLAAIRVATETGTGRRAEAFRFYTEQIAALSRLDFGLERSADQELSRNVATLQALGEIKEAQAQERALLNGVFSAGGFVRGEFLQFAAMRGAKQAALERFDQQATEEQRRANAYVLDTGAARTAEHFEQVALDAADGRNLVVNPQSWWSALTTVLDDMRRMQQYVGSQIEARAETVQNEAAQRIAALILVVLLAFIAAGVLLVTASRSITRPLAALAAEADSVASERLPTAVARVQTADADDPPAPPDPVRVPAQASAEIRSVAGALDRVQSAAYALATEQAVLRRRTTESLANLGRRNQNLLRRQIGFITNLEREETDPSGLANLFELDHLATRMRRNAESLLVLAGAATPRQWAAPLPVADVIRAALSEVEEYRRVTLRRIDDVHVSGVAVAGIAHMLAELIENGLAFSPPDAEVEIQGRQLSDTYLIAVIDSGVGMAPDELAAANARLRGESDFVVVPSRYLGHHVVGHLARQLQIRVELSPSPVTGITARVNLPDHLLTRPDGRRPESAAVAARARAIDAQNAPTQQIATLPHTREVSTAGAPVSGAGYEDPRWHGPAGQPTAVPEPAAAPVAASSVLTAPQGPSTQPYIAIDRIEYIVTSPPPAATPILTSADASYGDASYGDASYGDGGSGDGVQHPTGAAVPDGVPAGWTISDTGPPADRTGIGDGGSGAGYPNAGTGRAVPFGDADPSRTRNGLVKRPPRGGGRPAADRPVVPAPRRPEPSTTVEHSPSEVRARLSSLRAGVRRGEDERRAAHPSPAQPNEASHEQR